MRVLQDNRRLSHWALALIGFLFGAVGGSLVWFEISSLGYGLFFFGWTLVIVSIVIDRVLTSRHRKL